MFGNLKPAGIPANEKVSGYALVLKNLIILPISSASVLSLGVILKVKLNVLIPTDLKTALIFGLGVIPSAVLTAPSPPAPKAPAAFEIPSETASCDNAWPPIAFIRLPADLPVASNNAEDIPPPAPRDLFKASPKIPKGTVLSMSILSPICKAGGI